MCVYTKGIGSFVALFFVKNRRKVFIFMGKYKTFSLIHNRSILEDKKGKEKKKKTVTFGQLTIYFLTWKKVILRMLFNCVEDWL